MLFHHLIKIIQFFVLIISKTVLFCVVASYTESRRALKRFISTKKEFWFLTKVRLVHIAFYKCLILTEKYNLSKKELWLNLKKTMRWWLQKWNVANLYIVSLLLREKWSVITIHIYHIIGNLSPFHYKLMVSCCWTSVFIQKRHTTNKTITIPIIIHVTIATAIRMGFFRMLLEHLLGWFSSVGEKQNRKLFFSSKHLN